MLGTLFHIPTQYSVFRLHLILDTSPIRHHRPSPARNPPKVSTPPSLPQAEVTPTPARGFPTDTRPRDSELTRIVHFFSLLAMKISSWGIRPFAINARHVHARALAATTASRKIRARLPPGSGELALAQKAKARDVHDHIAGFVPHADQHLLGVLQQPLDIGDTLCLEIIGYPQEPTDERYLRDLPARLLAGDG